MIATPTELRLCLYCGERKPLDQFRRRRKSDDSRRVHQCNDCHKTEMRAARKRRMDFAMGRFVTRAHQSKDVQKLCTFLGLTFQKFGGVEKFSEKFAEYVHSVPPERALIGFSALLNLMIAYETLYKPPDPNDMSTEDLEAEMCRLIEKHGFIRTSVILGEDPEFEIRLVPRRRKQGDTEDLDESDVTEDASWDDDSDT